MSPYQKWWIVTIRKGGVHGQFGPFEPGEAVDALQRAIRSGQYISGRLVEGDHAGPKEQ